VPSQCWHRGERIRSGHGEWRRLFNELSESWGANADTGVPFFGWVRDAKGKPIARAIVTATVQDGPDGQSVTIISDNLGHYKIPASARISMPRRFVIDCAKVGYRAIQQDRRILRSLPKASDRSGLQARADGAATS